MIFHLDTNAVIAILNRNERARTRFADAGAANVAVSPIVFFELHYGIAKSLKRQTNDVALEVLFTNGCTMLEFGHGEARIAGQIRASLETKGVVLGSFDLLIAAHALHARATLVTNDKAFSRVPGLVVEDWTKPKKR